MLLFLFLMGAGVQISGQVDSIFIKMEMQNAGRLFHVQERISYKNNLRRPVDSIKLLAWANAYRNSATSLGKRKLEERKTTLYFAEKEEKGEIRNLKLIGDQALFHTDETEENIYFKLKEPLDSGAWTQLELEYDIQIPIGEITGYGWTKDQIFLKYFFLVPDKFENENLAPRYFLDMGANQAAGAYWDIDVSNSDFEVQSNLLADGKGRFSGTLTADPELLFSKEIYPKLSFDVDGSEVLLETGYSITEEEQGFLNFYIPMELAFVKNKLGFLPKKIFISPYDYKKNGFLGIDDIRFRKWIFKIFDDAKKSDLNYFSILSKNVVDQLFISDEDQYHWLYNGLKTYLEIEYLKKNYGDEKLLGRLPESIHLWKLHPLKWFDASRVKLLDRYGLVYQYIMTQNLDQKISTPLHDLSKFNVLAISNFEAGTLLSFISAKSGEGVFDQFLANYFHEKRGSVVTGEDFMRQMEKKVGDWTSFFPQFIQQKNRVNFKIKSTNPDEEGNLVLNISKNTDNAVPFEVKSSFGDGGEAHYFFDAPKGSKEHQFLIPKHQFNQIALNPLYSFPETDYRDNYIYGRRTLTSKKKLRFQIFDDIPNPAYNEIFWSPRISWNNYDKFLVGIKLTNKSLLPADLIYSVSPTFSTGTTALTGSAGVSYSWKPADAFFSDLNLGTSGSYYHYDYDLAYQTFNLYTNLNFAKNPRSQISRMISLSYNYFHKQLTEELIAQNAYGKYNLWNLGYSYSDNRAIHEQYLAAGLQWMDDFQKISAEYYYRWEYAKNKKLMLRAFGGLFINNHTRNDLFDFGISKVSNYAFNYGLLGQSAKTGVLSQQFILAEGGFKSMFDTQVNQWIVAANVDTNLWKMFNVYADAGVYKNKGEKMKFIWDSGIKLRIIPDFLEVYLPVQSSFGFEPARENYTSRIRFTLNFNLSAVINYFRRGVF